jgi:adenylylsulfate kinase
MSGVSGVVVWLTGLPAAGKSTLAEALRERLQARGRPVCVLDSDELRAALRPRLGYDDQARDDFYATLANLAVLFAGQGMVVLVAATANLRRYRDAARARAPRFMEVYVRVDPEECARRDPKGLYAAVRAGTLSGLPGVDAGYEPPESAEVVARGGQDADALERVLVRVLALR